MLNMDINSNFWSSLFENSLSLLEKFDTEVELLYTSSNI
jgi:hypothetical protein